MATDSDLNEQWGDFSPIDTLHRLFGEQTATAFRRAFGGIRLYIPMHPGPDHEISRVIGHARAEALGAELGQVNFYIPKPKPRRHEQVAELAARGIKNRDIAQQLGLTERCVYAIRRKIKLREQNAAPSLTDKGPQNGR